MVYNSEMAGRGVERSEIWQPVLVTHFEVLVLDVILRSVGTLVSK